MMMMIKRTIIIIFAKFRKLILMNKKRENR